MSQAKPRHAGFTLDSRWIHARLVCCVWSHGTEASAGEPRRARASDDAMTGRRQPYISYLLRLWLVEDDGPVWRASLENPTTAERHGFATLDRLVAFLMAETRDLAAQEQWEREMEVTEMASDQAFRDLLGRAVADEEFRSLLLADPERALRQGGFDLTAEQLAALLETDRSNIAEGLAQWLSKRRRREV